MLEPLPPAQTAGPAVRPAGRPAAALSPPSQRVAAVSGRPPHNPAKTGYRVPLQIGLVTCHFMKIKRTDKKARACFGELSCQDRIVCTNVTSSHSVVQFLVANLYALLPAPVAWRSQHLGVQFY